VASIREGCKREHFVKVVEEALDSLPQARSEQYQTIAGRALDVDFCARFDIVLLTNFFASLRPIQLREPAAKGS
jgi:hypothetical protein